MSKICQDSPMVHSHRDQEGSSKGICIAFFLNLGFTIFEIFGGLVTNSTAILADAVHDLGDTFALGQAWYFERLAVRGRTNSFTYGFRRFSVLGALISSVFLLASSLYILSQAVPRIIRPEHSNAPGMVVLAVVGVIVNGMAMKKLAKDGSISSRTIALHFLEDVLGWVAVLIVAAILLVKDIHFLDPVLAVLITLYVLGRLTTNLRSMLPIFLQAAPKGVDVSSLTRSTEKIANVRSVHHLHVWSLDGKRSVFSAHIIADRDLTKEEYIQLKDHVRQVAKDFGIYHSTVEIEFPEEACRISSDASCS